MTAVSPTPAPHTDEEHKPKPKTSRGFQDFISSAQVTITSEDMTITSPIIQIYAHDPKEELRAS